MFGCKQKGKKEKITFPIHVWDGEGEDVPIGSAGAECDLHEDFCLSDHTFGAHGKTESLEVWVMPSHCL